MISSRRSYLLHYWENVCCPAPTTILRSAIATGLLDCISLEQAIHLIVSDIAIDPRLREKVLTRIANEAASVPRKVYDSIVRWLLDTVASDPHRRKVTAAYCLEGLYDCQSPTARKAIIHAFLQSPQRGLRRCAYRLLQRNWQPAWRSEIQRCWEQWHDLDCTHMIVEHFDVEFLVNHINQLTDDLNHGADVARLYLRACSFDAGLLTKLRKLDGITYAYVSARLSKTVPKRVASHLLRKYREDTRLGILAWSLGKFGYWSLLVKLSKDVAALEEELSRKSLEHWGVRADRSG